MLDVNCLWKEEEVIYERWGGYVAVLLMLRDGSQMECA
jgi:hypothetical protein